MRRGDSKLFLVVGVLLAVMAGCELEKAPPTGPPPKPQPAADYASSPVGSATLDRIVFMSYTYPEFELAELYSIYPDGTGRRRITRNVEDESGPNVTPDGSVIYHRCGLSICKTDPTGERTNHVLDANDVGGDVSSVGSPAVSPNGRLLAFTGNHGRNAAGVVTHSGIYLYDLTTEAVSRVAFDPDGQQTDPTWSPDGDLVWSTFETGGDSELVAILAGGDGSPVFLTDNNVMDNAPDVSPDGTTLVFTRHPPLFLVDEIYSMPFTGNVEPATKLTATPGDDTEDPNFSPDGQRIVFSWTTPKPNGSCCEDPELATIPAAGGPMTLLTQNDFADVSPDWADIPPVVALDKPDRVAEAGGSVVLDVLLDAPRNTPTTVAYATSDGTAVAGSDYVAKAGTVTFAPNETRAQITIALVDDGVPEPLESFTVTLSNPSSGATLARSAAPAKIEDDDPEPTPSPTPTATATPTPTPSASPPSPGRIAFVRDANGFRQLFSMKADGSDVKHVSPDQGSSHLDDPSWSSDGLKIIYTALNGSQPEILERPADGTGSFALLITHPSEDVDPVYKPGSTTEFWWASNEHGDFDLFRGPGRNHVTTATADEINLTFGTDATKIAYASNADGDFDVYLQTLDGNGALAGSPVNLTQETGTPSNDKNPDFSPDGTKIVFDGTRDGNSDIYMVDVASRTVTRLTTDTGLEYEPTFSPDGKQIAFVREVGGNAEIFRMDARAGATAVNVSNNPAADKNPEWGPASTNPDAPEPSLGIALPTLVLSMGFALALGRRRRRP